MPFHNPLIQACPDAMHTVKVAVEHIFHLITGKKDSEKVKQKKLNYVALVCELMVQPGREAEEKWRAVAGKLV